MSSKEEAEIKDAIIKKILMEDIDSAAKIYKSKHLILKELSKSEVSWYVERKLDKDVIPAYFYDLPKPIGAEELEGVKLHNLDNAVEEEKDAGSNGAADRNLSASFTSATNPPPRPQLRGNFSGLIDLEEIMRRSINPPDVCVFLHPTEKRDYTPEELVSLNRRDFQTRLFICATQCAGDTVFLRTHHTDNAGYQSHFNYVRDYIKAAHVTRNSTCAKSCLTALLTMCFELPPHDYFTFATSLASGLSNNGHNTHFEICNAMAPRPEVVPKLRMKLCLLMDVVFSKIATKKFLLDDKRSNIFRLVHCKTKYSRDRISVYSAIFSFTLQLCLTVYLGLEHIGPSIEEEKIQCCNAPTKEENNEYNIEMLTLAIFTFTYSFIVAMSTISDTVDAYKILFRGISPLMLMDFIVNIILPLILACHGFLLILSQTSFIDAVLNATALLFIPEIDDQLPQILGYREDDIIRNYLITESVKDYDQVEQIPNEDLTAKELNRRNTISGIEFGDYYITNEIEQGINTQQGQAFQPYQVTQTDGRAVQIDPSTTVTSDCLLRKIEWSYTTGFPRTTTPRIGLLILTKLNGQEVQIRRGRDINGKVGISSKKNSMEGLFIMTTFQMSEDVLKLRLCGSFKVENFLRAFEYYSLWDITSEAKREIKRLQ